MKVRTFALIVFLICASSFGQGTPLDGANTTFTPEPNTYGTLSETSLTVSSFAFEISFAGTTWAAFDFQRYVTNFGGCCLVAPVTLPAGALIIGYELEACDDSATGRVAVILLRCPVPGGGCAVAGPTVNTGDPDTPGCGLFRGNLSLPLPVDNVANSYLLQIGNNGDLSGALRFRSVRIYYKLQVSPPPGTATFTDVPTTHPFYQYIEALAASGVTAGCSLSPPQFCPDATLTRGQMAVFLARALGLHWVP